jgi:hypothetical protein
LLHLKSGSWRLLQNHHEKCSLYASEVNVQNDINLMGMLVLVKQTVSSDQDRNVGVTWHFAIIYREIRRLFRLSTCDTARAFLTYDNGHTNPSTEQYIFIICRK